MAEDRYLPKPRLGTDHYLAAVHERIGETNDLLRQLLGMAQQAASPAVEPEQAGDVSVPVKIEEPVRPDSEPAKPVDPEPQSEPEPEPAPAKKAPAKKTAARKRS